MSRKQLLRIFLAVQSEKHLKSSGLDYTIVRPGGLKSDPQSEVGNLILQNEDTLRAKKTDPGTAISRETVSRFCSVHLKDIRDNEENERQTLYSCTADLA